MDNPAPPLLLGLPPSPPRRHFWVRKGLGEGVVERAPRGTIGLVAEPLGAPGKGPALHNLIALKFFICFFAERATGNVHG